MSYKVVLGRLELVHNFDLNKQKIVTIACCFI